MSHLLVCLHDLLSKYLASSWDTDNLSLPMDILRFTKMTGAGNDFVVIDNRALTTPLTPDYIAWLCARHFGVGADGLLAAEPSDRSDVDYRMRYYNADGSEAEMC